MRTWFGGIAIVGLGALSLSCSGSSSSRDAAAAGARDGAVGDQQVDSGGGSDAVPVDSADLAPDRAMAAGADALHDATPPDAPADGGGGDAPTDTPASGDAGDATGDTADTADAGDAGGPCGAAPCAVGSNWAQWPMPNGATDVANGASHPAMLVDDGDDTITDGVTGLMWQRTASITLYDRAHAQARCTALRVGAHGDWRVPTAIELVSILDYDHSASSLDAVAFPNSPLDVTSAPWSIGYFGATTVAGTPVAGWLVDFAFGQIQLDTTSLDRGAFVRCVRGPAAPASDTSANRYDLSTTGLARDIKTELTWQRTVPLIRRTLSAAKTYCATGSGLPGTGWRLPTIKELMTLVDFSKTTKNRLDETIFNFPTDGIDTFGVVWSATSVVGKPPYSTFTSGTWTLYSDAGNNNYVDSGVAAFVRCVR